MVLTTIGATVFGIDNAQNPLRVEVLPLKFRVEKTRDPRPETLNRNLNPKPYTPNPKHKILNPNFRILNPKP